MHCPERCQILQHSAAPITVLACPAFALWLLHGHPASALCTPFPLKALIAWRILRNKPHHGRVAKADKGMDGQNLEKQTAPLNSQKKNSAVLLIFRDSAPLPLPRTSPRALACFSRVCMAACLSRLCVVPPLTPWRALLLVSKDSACACTRTPTQTERDQNEEIMLNESLSNAYAASFMKQDIDVIASLT